MGALAALAACALSPAVSAAGQKVISSPGSPLSSIYVDEDLGCQVQASGDSSASFFGGTEPGACGTFLALTKGDLGEEPVRHLFGPSPPGGVSPEADFTITGNGQKLEGKGTVAEPFTITTPVAALESEDGGKIPVADVTETNSYVTGEDFYTTEITVENPGPELQGRLYHAGRCLLSGLDTGYGAAGAPSSGSVACTIEPDDIPPARLMAFTPTSTTPAPSYYEGLFSNVWSKIDGEATPFPDTVDGATDEDNGMGLSWPFSLAEEETATVSFTTTITPTSPPTSSSSAGACAAGGEVPVTVSAVNGAKAVDYVLNGTRGSVVTEASGKATILLPPGQNTLEYWGEDETGAQEATHHSLSVTVGSPAVKITSEQGEHTYEAGEAASVAIVASGGGLTANPSAAHVPISTATPGTYVVSRSATNACGTSEGSFTYTVLAPPQLGKDVNAQPISGKVFVALPATGYASLVAPLGDALAFAGVGKGLHFVPLTEPRQLPVGTIFDTVAGVARITTATARAGRQQQGDFGAGIFKLLQARKQKGLTELDIMDTHSAHRVCATIGKQTPARDARAAAHLSGKVLGRLTGTAHGKFTMRGQYSAATVRGTQWGVRNQCDGTLTRVERGVVTVRDFVRRKTITLFTGQSYLARP